MIRVFSHMAATARLAAFGALASLCFAATQATLHAEPAQEPEQADEAPVRPTVYRAEIVKTYPHDTGAFTQGLLWHDGVLYESTGRPGQSGVRKVELETGKVLTEHKLRYPQFGEGLALYEGDFISLTWQAGVIHRWSAEDLSPKASFDEFPFEGWGLTTSPEGLIHSDGTDIIRILEPDTYEVVRSVSVTVNGRPLSLLNELEFIDGLIFANVWQSGYIVAIDPADGVVRKLIDLRAIVAQVPVSDQGAVLNGIAWDADAQRLFVTGKLWPSLFEIRLVETAAQVR